MNVANLPQVMVTMAQSRLLPEVLRSVVSGIAECRNVVLARIWLIEPGDICATCRFRPECPDQTRCLHLVASAGNSDDPKLDYTRLDGSFRRFPLGVRKIGQVGKTGEPLLLPGLRGDESWIADPEWIKRSGIHTVAAQPLIFHGEVLGVLAIFDTGVLGDEDFRWLRVFADHAAVSIANARAFAEIESLRARLEEENKYLWEEVRSAHGFGDIIGESPGLRKVMQQIQLVAPTEATVLVTGESGTGKELVAKAIHANSKRGDRPFVPVNCAAITETLLESELFGHAKGSFTGAVSARKGLFEEADGGTFFFDEIAETPITFQAKLLRAIQENEIRRVGENKAIHVNVRIIAATNQDLLFAVAEKRFRQDLYYRLNVARFQLPPLRERREDIPDLLTHFLDKYARKMGVRPRLQDSVAEALMHYDFPGNIRELEHMIEQAVALVQSGTITADDVLSPPASSPRGSSSIGGRALAAVVDQAERGAIEGALRESEGSRERAADLLSISPTTLWRKMTRLGITFDGRG